jgi:hypothetical protein
MKAKGNEQSIVVQDKKIEKSDQAGYRTRVAESVVGVLTTTLRELFGKRMTRYLLYRVDYVVQSKFTMWQYDLKWSTINVDILILQGACSIIIVGGWIKV